MAINGAIIGDIIGSQYESERCENPESCSLFTKRCSFTDDTVCALAIKHAIDTGISFEKSLRIIGRNHPAAGYAGMFEKWLMSDDMLPYGSWGNGSAMRVSYIGEYFDNIKDVEKWAKRSAEITHNSPEGIKGAVTTAVCIHMAKNKCTKDEIFNYLLSQYPSDEYPWSIEHDLNDLRENYSWSVKCQDCVPVAIRCFYEADSYESFIRNVLSLDCDADTLGAIGGGVAEEFFGKTGFDNNRILQDFLTRDLYHIAHGEYKYIIKHHNRAESSPSCYWGRTGSNKNNGFCPAIKRHAYVFTPQEIESDDVNQLLKVSKTPIIIPI